MFEVHITVSTTTSLRSYIYTHRSLYFMKMNNMYTSDWRGAYHVDIYTCMSVCKCNKYNVNYYMV
jgi:hypothetical protein